ncbi:MAG: dihydroorotate dehydrogenase electron transfer subunit [Magnetococcales bacterium]|nr:dihydroorotate dehydrogenase electron transfer subunit [Magnetococcales bacterium]
MDDAWPHPGIHHRPAVVLDQHPLPDRQYWLRLEAPQVAASARPGQFVHLVCGPDLTLPRPFSIFDADPAAGTIEILYRVVGIGTGRMTAWRKGTRITLTGPVGRPFAPITPNAHFLLLAGGIGLAPLYFLARRARVAGAAVTLLLGTESAPAFATTQSRLALPGVPIAAGLALALLEEQGVLTRLAALHGAAGYFSGFVTDLARAYLAHIDPITRTGLRVCACGPTPMLKATTRLLSTFGLEGELSLEAHMACGFGGCAGCAVPIYREGKMATATHESTKEQSRAWHYQRACVDGPVFAATQVAWAHYPAGEGQ